jgi:hypothetical protein
MRRAFVLLVAVTLMCGVIGCKNDSSTTGNTPSGPGPGGPPPGSGSSPTGPSSAAPVDKDEFAKMMAEDKPAYLAKIEELKKKADALTGEEQRKLKDKVADLESRLNDSANRYEQMDKNTGYWASVSGNMKTEWEKIKKDIDAELGVPQGAPEPKDSGTESTTKPDTAQPTTNEPPKEGAAETEKPANP